MEEARGCHGKVDLGVHALAGTTLRRPTRRSVRDSRRRLREADDDGNWRPARVRRWRWRQREASTGGTHW